MRKNSVFILAVSLSWLLAGCSAADKAGAAADVKRENPTCSFENVTEVLQTTNLTAAGNTALPENLPDTPATAESLTGEGGYLLLGCLPEADIALYCDNLEERNQVYLRYGEAFQKFEQKVWTDPTVLPELSVQDQDEDGVKEIAVRYLRHEGEYFDGETTSPGLVCEFVIYRWDENKWTDIHFSSSGPICIAAE